MRIRNRKPRLELGLLVMIVGLAMIIIAALNNVGQLLQNPRAPPCFPQTCPYLGFFTLLGVAGFFVALWGAIETIVAFLIQEGSLQHTPGPLPPLRPGSGPEDENLLSMARDLQKQFKRPKFGTILSLAWSEAQPWYRARFKRRGIRKPFILLLSADLRGRLSAEEWRTMLTYYFLQLKPGFRLFLEFLGLFFGILLLIPLVGLLVSAELGLQAFTFYAQFIARPILLLNLILILPNVKRGFLRADKWSARSIGRKPLLDLFEKIDRLKLPRIEKAKKRHGWTLRLWPMPNITERIKNLTDEY